ncbi:uncharacterized protein LOC124162246 isoform X2 [Ischnura elegans]|uniref:uncharacterized protein LOC124162246 isoform X2 n=1 Tax=Ischnura elegans TaxID=197161 RepID=UPI001ED8BEA9|nr:uncharacterized protein LOC124162246 isoform X2 [Ischnura elegans]
MAKMRKREGMDNRVDLKERNKAVYGVNLPSGSRGKFLLCTAFLLFSTAVILLVEKAADHAGYRSIVTGTHMLFFGRRVPGDEGSTEDNFLPCQIPQLDPWDLSVRPFVRKPKPFSCKGPPPLTYLRPPPPVTTGSPSAAGNITSTPSPPSSTPGGLLSRPPLPPRQIIKINASLESKYGHSKDGVLKCCAGAVTRGRVQSAEDKRADGSYRFEKCRPFSDTIEVGSDFTLVECKRGKKKVYTDMHSTVIPTKTTLRKIDAARKGPLPPSILLLGLDSSSRLNIHRSAPKLIEALSDVGAVEMNAYNKVGDNTLPNLLPILTGVSLPDANNHDPKVGKPVYGKGCWPNNKYVFDKCPFIWRNFSEKGYVTMFGEDEPSIAIFNYHKLGFREQPTDHYLRPFYVVAEKRLQKITKEKATWCYANKDTFDRLLEYLRSFVDTYARRAPFFALMFMTGISHENPGDIELADSRLADLVRHVVRTSEDGEREGEGGLFLTVFSDHGSRWGPLRESPFGWLEERLPFLFIRPPHASPFLGSRATGPLPRPSALQTNGNRLTSPFDFHETLSALLHGSEARPNGTSCDKCFDLLNEEVPEERTCADAAIPGKWCACAEEEKVVVDNSTASRGLSLAVDYLNGVIRNDTRCSFLSMGQVMSTTLRTLPSNKSGQRLKFLVAVFSTVPSNAVFEVTIFVKDGDVLQVSPDISRLNTYGNDSWCVDDPNKKLYCYCI